MKVWWKMWLKKVVGLMSGGPERVKKRQGGVFTELCYQQNQIN
jgi:hypothetical protein